MTQKNRRANHADECPRPPMNVTVVRETDDRTVYEARCPTCGRASLYDEPKR